MFFVSIDILMVHIAVRTDFSGINIMSTVMQVGLAYLLFFMYMIPYVGVDAFRIRPVALGFYCFYILISTIYLLRHISAGTGNLA